MNIFEQATRRAIRFESAKGDLSVEQLWDLPLQSRNQFDLDTVAKTVNRQLNAVTEESFVSVRENPAKETLSLKLEIVKHIISVKLQEADQRAGGDCRWAARDRPVHGDAGSGRAAGSASARGVDAAGSPRW